ncbi:MAG: hypothetical protein IT546_11825 [Caulobacteraceae bacterium]|nr:hypothetical protein [Caulobacteraceae bacterium]
MVGSRSLFGLTLASLLLASGAARAQQACPPRPTSPPSPTSGAATAPRSPEARALAVVDQAYDQGRLEEAVTGYQRLINRYPRMGDDSQRAKLRLARALTRQGQYERAIELANEVARAPATPRLGEQGAYYAAAAAWDRDAAVGEAAYDSAEALVRAGDPAAGERAFQALLTHPCPVRPDFYSRVNLRLAALALQRQATDEARARLNAAGPASSDRLNERADVLRDRLVQTERDVALMEATAPADAQRQAGDFVGAAGTRRAALQGHPQASADVRVRVSLDIADDLSRAERFDEALATVQQIPPEGMTPQSTERVRATEATIRERQQVSLARTRLAEADGLRAAGRGSQALAAYDAIINDDQVPPAWRQRAALRKSALYRGRDDFRPARELAQGVAAAPADDSVAELAKRSLEAIAADTPLNMIRGYVQAGLVYDSNAPAETAAIRGEDEDLPYPPDQDFEDTALSLLASVEYRRRLTDDYDYLRVLGGLAFVKQSDLEDLDRLSLTLRAGPVLRVGDNDAIFTGGVLAGATWRGGDWLYDDGGVYAEYGRRFGDWRVLGSYSLFHRNDTRNEYDGWRHRAELTASRQAGGFGPAVSIEIGTDEAELAERASWSYGLGGAYGWRLGATERSVYGLEVFGNYRHVRFDDDSLFGNGRIDRREDDRWRFGAALEAVILRQTVLRLEYSRLDINSNDPFRERDNNRIGVSVRRRF